MCLLVVRVNKALLLLLFVVVVFATLFMTIAADTVALNISYEGLLSTVLLIMMKK